ncbi:ATP-binding protein [Asanoa sp. WMMD1127]|uniref:ATP-binding protein n=1 Tax=Asanoa sp. WMMD1127 TaxID=3016107 RepID=UPI002417FA93|nr:ATP-binding protein [Asanoa sp. WMMD1127]MDG4820569.1 ATP-binding protein [Asanoa sp. WMMD1127]
MAGVNRAGTSSDGYSLLLSATFDGNSCSAVRHEVRASAARSRLDGETLDDFITAVNEIMTNVVRHGGGTGKLRLWRNGDLVCQVIDHGPGFDPTPHLHREHRPQPAATGGMGLWLAQQTSDHLTIASGPDGTTINIYGSLESGGNT